MTLSPQLLTRITRGRPPRGDRADGNGRGPRPQLADGVELIGEYEGSGFKEPPALVRRADGQVIQMPPLLYRVVTKADGRHSYGQIAAEVSDEIQRQLDGDQVQFLVEEKLRPMGVVANADGSSPDVEKPDPFLALKFRTAVIPERVSNLLGGLFMWLFLPPVLLAVLAAFVVGDAWLFLEHGVAQSIRQSILHPGLFLPLFAAVVLGAAFHEIGHAAACRYGGARPGRMGCGIYLAWPAFYTDVTDAYRLGRRGRLRTDLGGVYFNVVIVIATLGAYLATGFEPLLLLVIIQHFEIAHQLLPVIRLDGYYIVADLTGVPDLFARIGPILRSMIPGRENDPSVRVLKRWVRVAVTAWVLLVVPLLVFELVMVLIHLPRILGTAWTSATRLWHAAGVSFSGGDILQGVSNAIQLVVLLIPIAGILLMIAKSTSGGGRWVWKRTADRPLLRLPALAAGGAAAVLLGSAWIPSTSYQPIRQGERGTFGDAATALGRVARRGRLAPPARGAAHGTAGTATTRSTKTKTKTGAGANGSPTTTVTGRRSSSTSVPSAGASSPSTATADPTATGGTTPTTSSWSSTNATTQTTSPTTTTWSSSGTSSGSYSTPTTSSSSSDTTASTTNTTWSSTTSTTAP